MNTGAQSTGAAGLLPGGPAYHYGYTLLIKMVSTMLSRAISLALYISAQNGFRLTESLKRLYGSELR